MRCLCILVSSILFILILTGCQEDGTSSNIDDNGDPTSSTSKTTTKYEGVFSGNNYSGILSFSIDEDGKVTEGTASFPHKTTTISGNLIVPSDFFQKQASFASELTFDEFVCSDITFDSTSFTSTCVDDSGNTLYAAVEKEADSSKSTHYCGTFESEEDAGIWNYYDDGKGVLEGTFSSSDSHGTLNGNIASSGSVSVTWTGTSQALGTIKGTADGTITASTGAGEGTFSGTDSGTWTTSTLCAEESLSSNEDDQTCISVSSPQPLTGCTIYACSNPPQCYYEARVDSQVLKTFNCPSCSETGLCFNEAAVYCLSN